MDRLLLTILSKSIRTGNLRVTTARGSSVTLGDGTGPEVAIRFTSPAAEGGILMDPELRFGEAYMEGGIVVERGSIADVLGIVLAQARDGRPPRWARPQRIIRYLYRRLKQFNPQYRAQRNVA